MGAHGVLVGRDRKKETATIRFDDDDAIVTVPMDFVAEWWRRRRGYDVILLFVTLVRRAPEREDRHCAPLSPGSARKCSMGSFVDSLPRWARPRTARTCRWALACTFCTYRICGRRRRGGGRFSLLVFRQAATDSFFA